MLRKRGIIFSDVDGSLCFHEGIHGLRVQEVLSDRVIIRDELTGNTHETHDVSISAYNVYLAESTRRLAKAVRRDYEFVLVTGGRPSTAKRRSNVLDFADYLILENGGMILDREFNIDREWYERLEPERASLPAVREKLTEEGWKVDDKGRTSAMRVRLKDNPAKSPDAFNALCRDIELPADLKKTINLKNLDIILKSAGKDSAVSYLMKKLGYVREQSIGIGDDLNDISFLELTGSSYVLKNAYPEVLDSAKLRGWYISRRANFDGINEILEKLLSEA
jgi:hydroxymethylpyrimidine pyrophosphatase-like HAD family hydrolase